MVECTKCLWEETEEKCLAVLREVLNDLAKDSDLPVNINFENQKFLEPTIMGPTFTQTLRLFGFMVPALLVSPVLSIPGAMIGGLFAGATTTATGLIATSAACLGGAINGAIMAPIGGLALLAAGIATTVATKVDYNHYLQSDQVWDQDFLQRKALESVLDTLQNESTINSLRESISYLIQQNTTEYNGQNVDLGNSILCSSRRFFNLETNFDTWRVLSVELDPTTLETQEISYKATIFVNFQNISVYKRFSKFRELYLALCSTYPEKSTLLASFPPRTFLKSTEIGFLRTRCHLLLSWIKICEADNVLCESKEIKDFFNIQREETKFQSSTIFDDWNIVHDEDMPINIDSEII